MAWSQFRRNRAPWLLVACALVAWPSASYARGKGAPAATMESSRLLSPAPLPAAAAVQESQSLSTLRLEEPRAKSGTTELVAVLPSRRNWLALAIAEHGAAAFDAYTTRQAIGSGAVEADPLMRPFAHSPSLYAAIQMAPLLLDFAARHMQRSPNAWVRKMWWLPQTGGTAIYLFSGSHNLGVAGRP